MVQSLHHRETLLQTTQGFLSYTVGLLGQVCSIWVGHGEGTLESCMPFAGLMGLFCPMDGVTGAILLGEGAFLIIAFFFVFYKHQDYANVIICPTLHN
jgi:hypothetical protein